MHPTAQFPDEQSDTGTFQRQEDAFAGWVNAEADAPYPAASGRYHLYVSLACPWAHRTILVRTLKGLEATISLSVVDPIRNDEDGWAFRDGPGHTTDPINGFALLGDAYRATDANYRGRITVPVLWDTVRRCIVSNNDDDIMRMLNSAFDRFTDRTLDLYPTALRADIDALNAFIYERVNNGVYQAGFATTQYVHGQAVSDLFDALDTLEARLAHQRYLFGAHPTETDWRLFVTLIRFDPVYHGHFKCNLRRIVDYPNLYGYMRDLYQQPGVADTVNFDHIKRHYYITHDDINPSRIVPLGPVQDLHSAHGRAALA